MNFSYQMRITMAWFNNSILFFKNHFAIIIFFALIAAFGRTIQLGAFRTISSALNIILEVMIESARVLIFLYTLGLTNFKTGVLRVVQFFTRKPVENKIGILRYNR